jgi:hypothetical protein
MVTPILDDLLHNQNYLGLAGLKHSCVEISVENMRKMGRRVYTFRFLLKYA